MNRSDTSQKNRDRRICVWAEVFVLRLRQTKDNGGAARRWEGGRGAGVEPLVLLRCVIPCAPHFARPAALCPRRTCEIQNRPGIWPLAVVASVGCGGVGSVWSAVLTSRGRRRCQQCPTPRPTTPMTAP